MQNCILDCCAEIYYSTNVLFIKGIAHIWPRKSVVFSFSQHGKYEIRRVIKKYKMQSMRDTSWSYYQIRLSNDGIEVYNNVMVMKREEERRLARTCIGCEGADDRKFLKQCIIVRCTNDFFTQITAGTVFDPVPAFTKVITAWYVINETLVSNISGRSITPIVSA